MFPSVLYHIPALVQMMALHRTGDKAIIWANDDLVYWRIYTSLGLNELIQYQHTMKLFEETITQQAISSA